MDANAWPFNSAVIPLCPSWLNSDGAGAPYWPTVAAYQLNLRGELPIYQRQARRGERPDFIGLAHLRRLLGCQEEVRAACRSLSTADRMAFDESTELLKNALVKLAAADGVSPELLLAQVRWRLSPEWTRWLALSVEKSDRRDAEGIFVRCLFEADYFTRKVRARPRERLTPDEVGRLQDMDLWEALGHERAAEDRGYRWRALSAGFDYAFKRLQRALAVLAARFGLNLQEYCRIGETFEGVPSRGIVRYFWDELYGRAEQLARIDNVRRHRKRATPYDEWQEHCPEACFWDGLRADADSDPVSAETKPKRRTRTQETAHMSTQDAGDPKTRPINGDAVGWKVHALLRRRGAKDRFRAMLIGWEPTQARQQQEQADWRTRRDRFFAETVAENERLRDKAAGPPEDGWRYVGYVLHETPASGQRSSQVIGAWCPPDLVDDAEPPVDDPLSFCDCSGLFDPDSQSHRPLSLAEKYVVCAALHDAFCTGVEKIDPWSEPTKPDSFDGLAYHGVCDRVKELHQADMPAVQSFLEDVKANLPNKEASDAIKAGEAFVGAMESDPEARAGWEGARAKLQAFGKAMEEARKSPEYRAAQEAERRKWQDLANTIRERVEAAGDALAAQHLPRPQSLEDWVHLARIVEIPSEKIGALTAREIFACALAWADRQKIRAKLSAEADAAKPARPPAPVDKPKMSKKAKALAALADHPEWTDDQIAQAAGCHVKSLYRWKEYTRARELLRQQGRGTMPRGSKNAETGDVEAWDDE